ncbi:MAG: AbrB/MazE/SpoVT family DNA-binding domain-containing protein [Bosea sp. (in: a-proteobacteria)]
MNARFSKWGNSLALRIPAAFVQELSVAEGAIADMSVQNGCLIVKPVGAPRYDLAELVGRITETNLHVETDTGSAVGNEFG